MSLQLPKLAFLFAENSEFVGEWKLLDINLSREAIEETESNYALLEAEEIHALIKPRNTFSHKGNFGHALLIAGSYGMAGASILAARACMRSGVGLLTVHAPIRNNDILQTSVPEAIIESDASDTYFACPTDTDDYQAVGIGPGIGRSEETEAALLEQLSGCQTPLVLDADALNILANHRHALTTLPKGSILTPHPKELERMVGKCQNSYERITDNVSCRHADNALLFACEITCQTMYISTDFGSFFSRISLCEQSQHDTCQYISASGCCHTRITRRVEIALARGGDNCRIGSF